MNQDPKIDMEFLARFVKACRYMKKSPDWHKRLLYRLAEKFATAHQAGGKALTAYEKRKGE